MKVTDSGWSDAAVSPVVAAGGEGVDEAVASGLGDGALLKVGAGVVVVREGLR